MTGQGFASRQPVFVGAAEFIGLHLVEYLLAIGWRVRGLDDFSADSADNLGLAQPLYRIKRRA